MYDTVYTGRSLIKWMQVMAHNVQKLFVNPLSSLKTLEEVHIRFANIFL